MEPWEIRRGSHMPVWQSRYASRTKTRSLERNWYPNTVFSVLVAQVRSHDRVKLAFSRATLLLFLACFCVCTCSCWRVIMAGETVHSCDYMNFDKRSGKPAKPKRWRLLMRPSLFSSDPQISLAANILRKIRDWLEIQTSHKFALFFSFLKCVTSIACLFSICLPVLTKAELLCQNERKMDKTHEIAPTYFLTSVLDFGRLETLRLVRISECCGSIWYYPTR